jgi:hypothetical protein
MSLPNDKISDDKTTDLLMKLQCGTITLRECQAQLQTSRAPERPVHYKVSTKGCISFYGIRRMPISLYIQELEQLLDAVLVEAPIYNAEFSRFIDDNTDALRGDRAP